MQGKGKEHTAVFERYQQKAEQFMCSLLGKSTKNIKKTPGGLIFRQSWNNMQFVTSASFLAAVYSDYLSSSKRNLRCSQGNISPSQLIKFSKSQVFPKNFLDLLIHPLNLEPKQHYNMDHWDIRSIYYLF